MTPQKLDIGQQSHFSFVISDQTGIYEYARQPAGAVDPEVLPIPSYSLKYPLKAEASWEGTREVNLPLEKVSLTTQTYIESLEDVVTVPAGTFEQCVKTKTMDETSKDLGGSITANVTLEEQSWFCPDVGMVKSVRKEVGNHLVAGSKQVSIELASFRK